jgi:non-ribosomal peptide synthetase component F
VDAASAGIAVGARFDMLPADTATRLTQLGQRIVRHEDFWVQRLQQLAPLRATAALSIPPVPTAAGEPADLLTAALILYLARITDQAVFDIGFGPAGLEASLAGLEEFFAPQVPVRVALDGDDTVAAALRAVRAELARARAEKTYARSVVARTPKLRGRDIRLPLGILQRDGPESVADNDLTISVSRDGSTSHWTYRTSVFGHRHVLELQHAFRTFLQNLTADVDTPLAGVPLLTAAERERLRDLECDAQGVSGRRDRSRPLRRAGEADPGRGGGGVWSPAADLR